MSRFVRKRNKKTAIKKTLNLTNLRKIRPFLIESLLAPKIAVFGKKRAGFPYEQFVLDNPRAFVCLCVPCITGRTGFNRKDETEILYRNTFKPGPKCVPARRANLLAQKCILSFNLQRHLYLPDVYCL